jgi:hypothetical protein
MSTFGADELRQHSTEILLSCGMHAFRAHVPIKSLDMSEGEKVQPFPLGFLSEALQRECGFTVTNSLKAGDLNFIFRPGTSR